MGHEQKSAKTFDSYLILAGFLKFQKKKPTISTTEGDFTMEQ